MKTAFAAFRFSLVGFVLPFMFIYRPELLMMNISGGPATWEMIAAELAIAVVGIVALASGITGFFFQKFGLPARIAMLIAAALLLAPHKIQIAHDDPAFNTPRIAMTIIGGVIILVVVFFNRRSISTPPLSDTATA